VGGDLRVVAEEKLGVTPFAQELLLAGNGRGTCQVGDAQCMLLNG
jgi:hypothetical protein